MSIEDYKNIPGTISSVYVDETGTWIKFFPITRTDLIIENDLKVFISKNEKIDLLELIDLFITKKIINISKYKLINNQESLRIFNESIEIYSIDQEKGIYIGLGNDESINQIVPKFSIKDNISEEIIIDHTGLTKSSILNVWNRLDNRSLSINKLKYSDTIGLLEKINELENRILELENK